jgi:hypothetical protein
MSDEVVYQVLLQRMEEIQSSIRDVRDTQTIFSRDSRDSAIKLERVLGSIDQFSRMAEKQQQIERNVTAIGMRLGVAETALRKPSECQEKKHDKRIEIMERNYTRFITASVATLVVINLMIFAAKELL